MKNAFQANEFRLYVLPQFLMESNHSNVNFAPLQSKTPTYPLHVHASLPVPFDSRKPKATEISTFYYYFNQSQNS